MRFREGRLADRTRPWLLLPTELQSTRDAEMPERLLECARRHLRALRREGVLSREGEEPRVLPVVVYSGERRWQRGEDPPGAPGLLQPGGYFLLDAGAGPLEDWPDGNRVSSWARLLRARDSKELLRRLVEGLWAFPEAADESFREALHAWAQALWRRMMPDAGELPPRPELEIRRGELEMTTLLEANISKWKAGLVREGIAQGVAQGRSEERERLRELAQQLDPETAAKVAELLDQGE